MPCHQDRRSPLPPRYRFGDAKYPPSQTYLLTIEADESGRTFVRLPFAVSDARRPDGPAIERIYLPQDETIVK